MPESQFISGLEARRLAKTSAYGLMKAAALGRVKVRERASGLLLFDRADVLKLAESRAGSPS